MKNTLKTTPDRDFANRKQFFNILVASEDLKNKKVLDIGCGYGAFILHALENRALEVSGIEISDEDLKTVRNSIKNRNVILKKASGLDLPFPDNYFDTVVCFEVLEHIPQNTENQMFSEISRVLKKDGVLYLTTPFNSFLSKYFDPAFYLAGHRHYSFKQLKKYSEGNDLKIVKSRILGTIWEFLNLQNLYFSKWILRREKIFEKQIISIVLKDLKNESSKGFMNIYIKAKKN